MLLYLTRHGETDYNSQGRYQGRLDIPLNARGLAQAEELAQILAAQRKDLNIEVLLTSPLIRAKRTAEIVGETLGLVPVVALHFPERNMGIYEGLTRDEAKEKYPDHWQAYGKAPEIYAIPEGETVDDVDTRIREGLAWIKSNYPECTVLLVCHGYVARSINKQLLGLSFEEAQNFNLDNCQIISYKL